MPRNTREWALRKLDAAANNLEWSQKHLLEIVDKYIEPHPEIAAPIHALSETLAALQEAIKQAKAML